MNQCRVAITTKCNLRCPYCCMEYPEIQETFTSVESMQDIFERKEYSTFAITGGEPTLFPKLLQNVISDIKIHTEARVHLWTNGILLYPEFVIANKEIIDGINISIHEGSWNYLRWTQLHRVVPIRLHVWGGLSNDTLREFCYIQDILLREWKMDECHVDEDRYLLKDKYEPTRA